MTDITFERVKAAGIRLPLCAYGAKGHDVKLDLTLKDCEISFAQPVAELVRGAEIGRLTLENVTVTGVEGPLLRLWGDFRPTVRAKNLRGVSEAVVPGEGQFDVKGI